MISMKLLWITILLSLPLQVSAQELSEEEKEIVRLGREHLKNQKGGLPSKHMRDKMQDQVGIVVDERSLDIEEIQRSLPELSDEEVKKVRQYIEKMR